MCYIGRLKGSMYLVNARLVVRNAAKTANTKLDLRNAANSSQIEGKGGATWGPSTVPLPPCGVVGVWYGMLGMYGVYGRSGMACLESMVCLVCMVGMVCMA